LTEKSTNSEFWNGLSKQMFLLQYDQTSSRYQFYPRSISLFNLGQTLDWRPAAGAGRIIAFTEDRTRRSSGRVPILLVLVQLDEGPRVFAPAIGCQLADLKIGARVKFLWSETQAYPYQFELAGEDDKTSPFPI
jgi:uncharacterized OB-fold protein